MTSYGKALYNTLLCLLISVTAFSQAPVNPISLTSAFKSYGKNWMLAGDASFSLNNDDRTLDKGEAVIVRIPEKRDNTHLVTNEVFGDLELEFNFMMSRNATSGVLLMGRYLLNLADSRFNKNPVFDNCGGIAPKWDAAFQKGTEGIAPLMNVAKAPGLWQHLRIRFKAPRFDTGGKKVVNARFEEVYLNGILIQQQAQVTGNSRSAIFNDEKETGPLVLTDGNGAVAFKNISYRLPSALVTVTRRGNQRQPVNPVILNPGAQPYLLRGFVLFNNKKLTHTISVGTPGGLNYSYNLKQGALLQGWRGQFADVTDMWEARGEQQLARPLGGVVQFSNAPALAVLIDKAAAWPDSIAFDDLENKGYILDKERNPAFQYIFKGANVSDKISVQSANQSLLRQLSVEKLPHNFYCRLASATLIDALGKGLYVVNNKSYYIQINGGSKPFIRKTPNGQELIVALTTANPQVSYSLIW